jgi:hypothetical protein
VGGEPNNMKDGFTRAWSRAHVLVGIALVVLGLGLGGLAAVADLGQLNLPARARLPIVLGAVLGGVVLGGWAIVLGQLLDAILDQRRLLRRIDRRLRTWEVERREDAHIRNFQEQKNRRGRA